jgi:hypothetical protein
MMNRNQFAAVLPFVPADAKLAIFREHRPIDKTLDRSFRGCGNAAARKAGIDTSRRGCECTVCVVYGGDCAASMWQEDRSEWHYKQRGVRTRRFNARDKRVQ